MSRLSPERVQYLYDKFGDLKVLDDIIRHRAKDSPPMPILGYPKFEDSVDDYELFTGKQLDQFIDGAIEKLRSSGLEPNTQETVALLAPSNVNFIVSFFALSRLGFTILTLSLRITPQAIINLLKLSNCSTIVHGYSQSIDITLQSVIRDHDVKTLRLPRRSDYDNPLVPAPVFIREFDRQKENGKTALIMHSSGSTGLPKPVIMTHRAILTHPPQGSGLNNFNALPWYHLYGVSTSLQAMWMRKTAYLYNTNLPLTADNLVAVLEALRPEAIHSVPYALGLLAEKQRGIDLMKTCKIVTSAGARTPDELGNKLVKEGVPLGVVFGTTEAGLSGDTMNREKGDDSWNYIRIYANFIKYIYMDPIGDNQYECVYLKGHPALSTSNSDFPMPGSWHSKDVFIKHPSIPHAWKYVTRIDDRITLLNGEKILPLPIEGRIRQDKLIREAVVFGIDQAIPGLLVFRPSVADQISDDEYLDAIWPSIADANSQAEAFSQITRDMIILIPSNIDYPQTDKGNVIRAQVYKKFAPEITELYNKLDEIQGGSLKLDIPALEDYLLRQFKDSLEVPLESIETDFFTAGVDSLKAMQMRRIIQRNIMLSGRRLSSNIIYERGNVKDLAWYLYSIGQGKEVKQKDETSVMKQMIKKYSEFQRHHYANGITNGNGFVTKPEGQVVILTGATGSLGAHSLAELVASHKCKKVYCLVRGAKPMQRILDSLEERGLELSENIKAKIVAFTGDLSLPHFGLDASVLAQMKNEISLIIHIAWPVNFNIRLQSFEPHIVGLRNLLQFSLSVNRPQPAQIFFCSSISTALNTPAPASIPDTLIEDFSHASDMGYAQSKLVGEHIIWNAAQAGARSYVLRIGQIVGDTKKGIWNDKEFIPLMIRSALTLKALPAMQESCSWLPVDTVATVILEISETLEQSCAPHCSDTEEDTSTFHNIVNPRTFPWKAALDELHSAGLEFAIVPFAEWLQKLRDSTVQGDEVHNPAVKLIGYFENNYGTGDGFEDNGIVFETKAGQRHSAALRSAPDMMDDGYVKKYLTNWLQRWT